MNESSVKPAGKGTAIASLVCGICAIVCCCNGIVAIPALICGIISLVQTKNAGQKANGMAIAGVIIGAILVVLYIISLVITFTNPEYQSFMKAFSDPQALQELMNK